MVNSFAICDYIEAPSICLENLVHVPKGIRTLKATKVFLEKGQLNTITKTTKLSSLQLALGQQA